MVKLTDKCLSTVRISKRQFGIVRHLHNLHTYYKYPCTFPILKDSSFTIFMFDSSANAADNSKHGQIFQTIVEFMMLFSNHFQFPKLSD